MNTRKKISTAVVLAVSFAAPSFAIPISFDLSGTVQSRSLVDITGGTSISDTSWIGQSFSAQLVIDTDRFAAGNLAEFAGWRDFSQISDTASPAPWSASLAIAGNPIVVQPYALNYDYLQVQDTKGPQSCGDGCSYGVPDGFTLAVRSDLQDARGTTNSSLLQLNAYQQIDFSNPDPASSTYIDLSQPFSAERLLSIALPNLSFSYQVSTFDCDSSPGSCFASTLDITRFDVASVTRTDLSPASVPEPGTLTLLGAGLLAARFGRRRRQAA